MVSDGLSSIMAGLYRFYRGLGPGPGFRTEGAMPAFKSSRRVLAISRLRF